MNNLNILAALAGALRRCRLRGMEWPCRATGALHCIPPAHPYLSKLSMDSPLDVSPRRYFTPPAEGALAGFPPFRGAT